MPLCFLDYEGEFSDAWYHRSDDLHPAFNLLKEQKSDLWNRLQEGCGKYLCWDEAKRMKHADFVAMYGQDLYTAYRFLRENGAGNRDMTR